jgi:hypothetical protein
MSGTPRPSFVVTCIVGVFLSGCAQVNSNGGSNGGSGGGTSGGSTPPAAIAVTMSLAATSVQVGATQSFTATVANDPSNKGVTWTLSGSGCSGATCGTLSAASSASGVAITYSAPAAVPNPATVTLTGTSVADTTKSAATTITITAVPPAISVTLSPLMANVQVGATQAFTATVTNDSSNKGVTWTLAGAGCSGAACGTLSASSTASGLPVTYTASGSVPNPAIVKLTATSVADTTKSAAATITVTVAPAAIAVTLAPPTASVKLGANQPFTATVANDSSNKGVTWTLVGAGCSGAACGTLSANSSASGAPITYTAPASAPNPATVTLTATSVADATKSAAATITVTAAPAAISVTVAPTTTNVQVATMRQFTATVVNDPANKGVTWMLLGAACSENACGAISSNSSASGTAITYTAPPSVPVPPGLTLQATSVADPTKSASASITIVPDPPVSVTMSPTTLSLPVGGSQSFSATVGNDPANKGVAWTLSGTGCSGNACGTVTPSSSKSGVAVTYTAPGVMPNPPTVRLTATSAADGTKAASATITMTAPSGLSVTLTPKLGGIPISQTLNFTATVTNDVASDGVTWSATGSNCSGNACGTFTIATPSTTATYNAPATAGVYTITATSVADPTKSASATIGVTDLAGVTTYHNDLSRDGVNAQEYALTTANVKTSFGKLFSCTVDGAIYAQPLWVPNLSINGGNHNVIFVATQHDSLYAIDADTSPCMTLWKVSLIDGAHGGSGGETSVPSYPGNPVGLGQGAGDIMPEVGVTGTPVIDPSTSTLYVVSKSLASGSVVQRLHAIDLATGNENFAGPVAISASFPGNAPDSSGGQVTFNPRDQNQRPGLALVNGVVYIGWASHEDANSWHGWLMAYAATNGTLGQVPSGVFNTTPNTVGTANYAKGGIWMSGGAPAADNNNNLFLITGNGTFDGGTNFGDTLLKMSTSGGLSVADWFTPSDQANLDADDLDFGAGGAVVLINMPLSPVPHLVIGGGKQGSGNLGEIFVLNRDALGNFNNSDSQVVQKFPTGNTIYSTPAFWNNTLFVAPATQGGSSVNMQAYSFVGGNIGMFNTSPSAQTATQFGFPGPTPSVSASGGTNGIVWALDNTNYCTSQSPGCGPAVLHAYDGTDLSKELWNSGSTAGFPVKFTVPTVANGKVYIGTRGNDSTGTGASVSVPGELDVYGLLPN